MPYRPLTKQRRASGMYCVNKNPVPQKHGKKCVCFTEKVWTHSERWCMLKHHRGESAVSVALRGVESMRIGNGLFVRYSLSTLLVLSLAGCASNKYSRDNPAYDPQTVSQYKVQMTLNPLTEEELIDRFGTSSNPFLSPKLMLSRQSFRAFEVLVVNNTETSARRDNSIVVAPHTIRLYYWYRAVQPLTRLQLEDFWESGGKSDTRGRNMTKLVHTIRTHMFPSILTVEPGTRYRGILVFRSKFPQGLEGEMEIPTFTTEEQIIGVFRDPFSF